MKKCKTACHVLFLFMLLCLFTGCSEEKNVQERRALRVGVRDNIINFGFYNEQTDKFYGLEIDLAKELAGQMGYTDVEYVAVEPKNREVYLQNGTVDCVIACFSINEDRLQRMDFSAPYFRDEVRVLTQKSSLITAPEDLENAVIGVLKGSDCAAGLVRVLYEQKIVGSFEEDSFQAETYEDAVSFVVFENYDEMAEKLETGEIDAMCTDGCIAQKYLNDERMYIDMEITAVEYGIATPKDSDLSGRIGEALEILEKEGIVGQLKEKWG